MGFGKICIRSSANRLFIFAALFIFLGPLKQAAFAAPLVIDEDAGEISLAANIEIYEDVNGAADIDFVRSQVVEEFFSPNFSSVPNFGFTRSVIWVRFTLDGRRLPAGEERLLNLEHPLMDRIELYLPTADRYSVKHGGQLQPYSDREVSARSFVFRVPVGGRLQTLYLRLQTETQMTFPLSLWKPKDFSDDLRADNFILGLFYGIMLVMALYNLFVFISLGEAAYLYYVLTISFGLLTIAALDGTAHQYLWPAHPRWCRMSSNIFGSIFGFWMVFFIRRFIDTALHSPRLDRILQAIAIYCLLLLALTPMLPHTVTSMIASVGPAVAVPTSIAAMFISWRKKVLTGRYLFFAGIFAFLGAFVFNMQLLGVLPSVRLTVYSIHFGAAISVTLLALALADRINRLREQSQEGLADMVRRRTADLRSTIEELNSEALERALAEKKLKSSEQRFRTIFQTSPDLISISRYPDLTIIAGNETFIDIVGLGEDDLFKKCLDEIGFWASAEERGDFLDLLQNEGAAKNFSMRFKGSDGVVRHGLVSAKIIELEGDEHILQVVRDITDVREKEQSLQLMEKAIEVTLVGITITDLDGIIIYTNPAEAKMHGFERDELIGRDVGIFAPDGVRKKLSPIDLSSVRTHSRESVNVRRNGEKFPVLLRSDAVFDDEGRPIGMVTICDDITELKEAEHALKKSEERYRLLAENVIDVIWSVDLSLNYTYISPSIKRLLGYTPAEINGKSFHYTLTEESKALANSEIGVIWQKLDSTPNRHLRLISMELEQVAKDGKTLWTGIEMSILTDDEGSPIGLIGVTRDITRRKKAEDELRRSAAELEIRVEERTVQLKDVNYSLTNEIEERIRAEEELTRAMGDLETFTYAVAHDLKAPLRGVEMLSEWIEEDLGPKLEDQPLEHLRLLRSRVRRMAALIDGILEYMKLGRKREKTEEVDLEVMVDEITDLLSPPPTYAIEKATALPKIKTYRLQLQEVFTNLLSNAIKYCGREDGRIVISCSDQGEYLRFEVADNGPGVNPKYHDKVFELFAVLQAQDSVESTGIGLALVKKIVENVGGFVGIDSKPGDGATFYFVWPASIENINDDRRQDNEA